EALPESSPSPSTAPNDIPPGWAKRAIRTAQLYAEGGGEFRLDRRTSTTTSTTAETTNRHDSPAHNTAHGASAEGCGAASAKFIRMLLRVGVGSEDQG